MQRQETFLLENVLNVQRYTLQLYISAKNVETKAWAVMELDGFSGVRISGFLPNIATPEDLPIGTPVKVVGFDQRGLVLEKQ